ncbi:MAG: hypothetical protein ACYTGC_03385 [Planctomycetota bacterium]|jgi:hypothetical protein
MSPRQIATLSCKVLAVYTMIRALTALPQIQWALGSLLQQPTFSMYQIAMLAALASPLVLGAVGILLWREAGVVAAWMVRYDIQDHPEEREPQAAPLTADMLQTIAFSVLGLWLLTDAIPRLASWWGDAIFNRSAGRPPGPANLRAAFTLLELLLRIGMGFWLLFGAAGIVRLLRRLKNIGLADEPERTS